MLGLLSSWDFWIYLLFSAQQSNAICDKKKLLVLDLVLDTLNAIILSDQQRGQGDQNNFPLQAGVIITVIITVSLIHDNNSVWEGCNIRNRG